MLVSKYIKKKIDRCQKDRERERKVIVCDPHNLVLDSE